MVTTNDSELWSRMWSYKDHGKSWDAMFNRAHPPGFWWVHESFGTNWRMTEMQAAIARVQLRRMPQWHAQRTRNALALLGAARKHPVFRVPELPGTVEHAWYKASAFVDPARSKPGWDRERITAELEMRGVPCRVGGCPEIYLEKAFDGTDLRPAERLPVARMLGESSIVLMVHPTLTEEDIGGMCKAIEEVGEMATAQVQETEKNRI